MRREKNLKLVFGIVGAFQSICGSANVLLPEMIQRTDLTDFFPCQTVLAGPNGRAVLAILGGRYASRVGRVVP